MDATAIRPGFQSVVPYLAIQGGAQLVEFLATAFGARGTYCSPSGSHFEAKIGKPMLMIGDVGQGAPRPAQLFMYVEDAQTLYARALEAGATSVMEPCDKPWGDEEQVMVGASVKDPAGNLWFLAGPKSNPR
jgi:uncharacterized glyoxalase superfamily protein PhnB